MMLVLLLMTAALICHAASAMGRERDWRRWGVVAATADGTTVPQPPMIRLAASARRSTLCRGRDGTRLRGASIVRRDDEER